ncbi:hypothetical protein ACWFRF_23170 [Nocardia sp. NPDC055165]|uniref:hypothetical protein n=1 Tax=Nocardia sp. NPDC060220 TaxID=3347076 RepID=UPI00366037B2
MIVARRSTTLTSLTACAAALLLAAPLAAAEPAAPVTPAVTRDAPAVRPSAGPGDLLGAYQTVVETLKSLGIQPFLYPTVAANCTGDGAGLVPAVAGAVPGPWPANTLPIPGIDLSAVKSGQTLFTFLPYGLAPDTAATKTSGMQVAWLNISTGRGGMASMGSIADIVRAMVPPEVPAELRPLAETAIRDFLFAAIPVGGVRAVPVDTGRGTVLAAVFGTTDNAGRSCFFFPTIGITEVA